MNARPHEVRVILNTNKTLVSCAHLKRVTCVLLKKNNYQILKKDFSKCGPMSLLVKSDFFAKIKKS